jgi:hypothetical protein
MSVNPFPPPIAATMSDDLRTRSARPERPDGPPPLPVSPHLLTWWFGLMAAGGIAFGVYADGHPSDSGLLSHPLVAFAAAVLAGLMTLRFLHARPLAELISARCLAAGAAIAVACFFLGEWFGASLTHLP